MTFCLGFRKGIFLKKDPAQPAHGSDNSGFDGLKRFLPLKSDVAESSFIILFSMELHCTAGSNMMLSFQIILKCFERRLMLRLVTFCALAYVSKWSVAPAEFSFFSLVAIALIRMLGPR